MAEYTIDKIEYGGNVYKLQDTDEKLKVEAVSASEATSYFPIVSAFSATDAAVRQRDTTGFEYEVFSGTTSSQGAAGIRLGNKTASGTAGNKKGFITIYGTGTNCSTLYGPSSGSADYNVWLPNNGGTIALTTDITDEKLAVSALTERGSTLYYPLMGATIAGVSINTANTRVYDYGLHYTVNSEGSNGTLTVGNNTVFGYPSSGKIYLVGAAGGHTIQSGADNSGVFTATLPKKSGTVALTSDIPDVSGKIDTAGTGLSKSGTTLNHSNSVTAQTTQAVYPIKIDAQGHISAYGNAVTIPTNTDEKVSTTIDAVNDTVYYPIFGTDSTTASTKKIDTSGFKYSTYNGTASTLGTSILYIGNSISQGYANNKRGSIYLYSATGYKHTIYGGNGCSNDRTITLPDKTGTVALTSDIPSNIVNTITTTAGTHTAITSQKGNVSFNVPTKTSHLTNDSGFITNAGVTSITTTAGIHTTISSSTGAVSFNVPTKTSHLTNDSGFITSYTDEKLKWTASTTTNTYYPLVSTSTATTSTANTLNGINFYQYYNTAGGYRRLELGNTTANQSTGGAYGAIRLFGANATYYGDLVPGNPELGSSISGAGLSGNRTWKIPDKSGTIALTSDLNSYLKKPTDNVNFGWVLHTDGSNDSTYWNPPETFIIGVTDDSDNPGSYTLINTPDDIREAWNSGSAFILDLNMYNSSTAYFDTYRIMNYAMQYQSEGYHVLSFNGNINYYDATTQCTTVETIICTIYLDASEQYVTDGEVSVHFNDNLAIDGNMLVPNGAVYRSKNSSGVERPVCGITSTDAYCYGYGSYINNEGASYFDGNTVYIRSKNGINMTGKIYPSTNIVMPNNVAIHGKTANGSNSYSLIYASDNNNVIIGNNSWGDCYIYRVYTSNGGTSSSVPNVRITDAHRLTRTTHANSSIKMKHDIKDIENKELDPHRLYGIEVKQFVYNDDVITDKNDCRYHKEIAGFIAEQLYECYPIAVDINEKGECEAWQAQYIVPPMLKLIQEQHEEIEQLKKEVAELKNR